MADRRWSLEGASLMVGEVRSRTERARSRVESLWAQQAKHDPGSAGWRQLGEEIEAEVSRWVREMEALGLETQGVWFVDFDNGDGYYSWQWPEEDMHYVRGYEDALELRRRIQ